MTKVRVSDDTAGTSYRISKFGGVCKHCNEYYGAGQKVNWNPRVKGTCCHAGCYARYGSPVVVQETYTSGENGLVSRTPVTPFGETVASVVASPSVAVVEVKPSPVASEQKNGLGETIADAIAPYLDGRLKGFVTQEQIDSIIDTLMTQLAGLEGKVNSASGRVETLEVTVSSSEGFTTSSISNPHPKLKDVLAIVNTVVFGKRSIPYMHGPAGSGKTTLAMQVAQALGITFHTVSLNRQSTPTVVMGFVDAHGVYQGTPYAEAWINGGVILIDEFDNASGNLLTTFNTGWANGVMTFPNGQYRQHKDCIIVAAGNTCGRGADRQYNERQQLDAATLDRLDYIEVPYDEQLELALATKISPSHGERWCKYVQSVRAKVTANSIRITVSPRASYRGAALLQNGMEWDKVIETTIRKGLDVDSWNKIKGGY